MKHYIAISFEYHKISSFFSLSFSVILISLALTERISTYKLRITKFIIWVERSLAETPLSTFHFCLVRALTISSLFRDKRQ